MGFLKFLKRDKSKELDLESLDAPPMPPDLGDIGGKELLKFHELPKNEVSLSESEEKPVQKLKLTTESIKPTGKTSFSNHFEPTINLEEDIEALEPTRPSTKDFDMEKPEEEPEAGFPEAIYAPKIESYKKFEKPVVSKKPIARGKVTIAAERPIFVRVEDYKYILSGTSTIKNDLRVTNHSILKLNEINESRNRLFGKWHHIIMDLQKRFEFIDRTLFKGE